MTIKVSLKKSPKRSLHTCYEASALPPSHHGLYVGPLCSPYFSGRGFNFIPSPINFCEINIYEKMDKGHVLLYSIQGDY